LRKKLIDRYNIEIPAKKVSKLRFSNFTALARLISDELGKNDVLSKKQVGELGIQIHLETLRRVFRDNYLKNTPIDPRKVITLDKLCIFLKYKNWEDFVEKIKQEYILFPQLPVNSEVYSIIHNAKEAEFNIYKSLSDVDIENLDKYYVRGKREYKRICNVIEKYKKLGYVLNNINNPSHFNIFQFIPFTLKDLSIIITFEFWYLAWYSPELKSYQEYFALTTCQYISMESISNTFKISAINYYCLTSQYNNLVDQYYDMRGKATINAYLNTLPLFNNFLDNKSLDGNTD
jgi:hypothetical protein